MLHNFLLQTKTTFLQPDVFRLPVSQSLLNNSDIQYDSFRFSAGSIKGDFRPLLLFQPAVYGPPEHRLKYFRFRYRRDIRKTVRFK